MKTVANSCAPARAQRPQGDGDDGAERGDVERDLGEHDEAHAAPDGPEQEREADRPLVEPEPAGERPAAGDGRERRGVREERRVAGAEAAADDADHEQRDEHDRHVQGDRGAVGDQPRPRAGRARRRRGDRPAGGPISAAPSSSPGTGPVAAGRTCIGVILPATRPGRRHRRSGRRARARDVEASDRGRRSATSAEDPVHEAAAVVGREALGQLDGLVDDDGHRHVGPLGELEGAEAQHVEVEHRHPVEGPARRPRRDRRVEAVAVGDDATHEAGGELVGLDDLDIERVDGRDVLRLRLVQQVQRPLAGVGAPVGGLHEVTMSTRPFGAALTRG